MTIVEENPGWRKPGYVLQLDAPKPHEVKVVVMALFNDGTRCGGVVRKETVIVEDLVLLGNTDSFVQHKGVHDVVEVLGFVQRELRRVRRG